MTITALNFAPMDAEPTIAADLTADPETLSIHAWSQADDAEAVTTYIPRRSWKIPAAALALTASAAAVSLGAVAWQWSQPAPQVHTPTVSATKPQVAPQPPKPQTPDQRFLALVQQRGVRIISPPLAIHAAHWVCTKETEGYADPQIAANLVKGTPGFDLPTASIFVDTAHEVFCPAAS